MQIELLKAEHLPAKQQGCFVVIEGPNGSGKTTLINNLMRMSNNSLYRISEPSDTPIGKSIRDLIQKHGKIPPPTVQPLFLLDRLISVDAVIMPMLLQGISVISDRWSPSSIIYTRKFGGFHSKEANLYAIRQSSGKLTPCITILLDCSVDQLVKRRPLVKRDDAELIASQYQRESGVLPEWATGKNYIKLSSELQPEQLTKLVDDIIRIGRDNHKLGLHAY